MKAKLLILSFVVLASMVSCRRQQCPAYGKVTPQTTLDKKHA